MVDGQNTLKREKINSYWTDGCLWSHFEFQRKLKLKTGLNLQFEFQKNDRLCLSL